MTNEMNNEAVAETQLNGNKNKLTGWHVLAIILSMFGVIFAVNGFFMYKAITTSSGEIGHAYVEGLKFNETLSQRSLQNELGWQMELGFERGAGGDASFIAKMTDKSGAPLTGAILSGTIGRVVESKDDQTLVFKEVSQGKYIAYLKKLGPGKWHFRAQAIRGNDPKFTTETNLSIR